MAKTISPPILPGNPADPTGVDRLERGAMREFGRRMRKVLQSYKAALVRIPVEPAVNRRYKFELDQTLLSFLLGELDRTVDSTIFGDMEGNLWFFDQFVEVSARRGAAQAFANLSQQSPAYKAGRESVQNILRSQAYRRRMALVRARVFEEMKGLAADVKTDMARVLTDGVGRGLHTREIAQNLTDQAGIETRRAHKVARTEVTTALRRARWDETEDAQEEFGLQTRELHLSALSATTRKSHAARHGRLYTVDQVRDWWSKDGNSINCKCSTTSVMVDKDGNPIVAAIVDRARRTKKAMKARGYAWAKG
jgi:SPP1 gp7 family putative phage head morphogenesis protein